MNTQEYDIYLNRVCAIVVDFMNKAQDGCDDTEHTSEEIKNEFALKPAQLAAVKITLAHLYAINELNGDDREYMGMWVGLDCNIIAHILMEEWEHLNNETLRYDEH